MTLARLQFTVTDEQGSVVPGAHVEIRAEIPGAPLAALKSDRAGTVGMSNPSDADSDGFFFCYLTGGAYKVRVYTGPSGAPTFEAPDWRYVAVGLNSEGDGIGSMIQRVVTAAGDVTVSADDADIIFVDKTVGEATTVNLPSVATRTKAVRIIDGKADAATNNISIYPALGEKTYGIVDNPAIIDGNGGSVILTPRQDGSGWY